MLPAACLLLLFCHFCSSCSGPCCRRGRINVEPVPVPAPPFCWARRVQRLSRKKGQQSEKTKRKQKSNRKKNRPKQSSNFAGRQQKSSSLCQEQQNIYRHIYIYKTVQHMLLIAMENIFLFYENKAGRGTAKQTHTFLST